MKFLRRPEDWVFVILLASYAYFWQGRDWNISSRLMLTYAMVDRGSLSIDGLDDQTHDIALFEGHYYSDKAPGYSLLAVAPYVLAKKAFGLPDHPLKQPGFAHWPADYWITLGTSGLVSAMIGVILVAMARDLGCGPRRSALVGLAYGLATPAYAYATLAYGHQLAAFCLLTAFFLLWKPTPRPRLHALFAGCLAGSAGVVEIQVGPVSAILGLYILLLVVGKQRPAATLFGFGIGAAAPTLVLLAYNFLAFHSPWRMGYFYEVLPQFRDVHSSSNPLGIRRPDWSKVGELLWGERRGLVRFAPIVLLTPPGLVVLAARRQWAVTLVSGSTIAAILLVNLCYPEWTGGWSTGPRLLVPLLPFAVIPVAALLAVGGRWAAVPAVTLTLVGATVILAFVAIGARVPHDIDRPLVDGVWPLIRGDRPLPLWVYSNRYARNLASLVVPGALKRLPAWAGWASVVPLVLFQLGMVGMMTRFVREDEERSRPVDQAETAQPPASS